MEAEQDVVIVEDRAWSRRAQEEEPSVEERGELELAPAAEPDNEWYYRRAREIIQEDAERASARIHVGRAHTDREITDDEVASWRRNYPYHETNHERALNRYVDTYLVQQERTHNRSLAKEHLRRMQQRLEEEMGRVAEGHVFGEGAYVEISNTLRQAFLLLEKL